MGKSHEEQKRIERWFVEAARRASPVIPEGHIFDFERPDFTLASPGGPIGIEVTELLRKNNTGPFPPIAEADLHTTSVQLAEERYRQSNANPVKATVYFTNDWKTVRRAQDVATVLSDFVASHNDNAESSVTFTGRDVPAGFDVIGIGPPDGRPWLCGELANLGPLKSVELEAAIRDKEKLLPIYRGNVPNAPIWLLIYISVTTSRIVAVPVGANEWAFESSFDKILLFNYPEGEVFDIGCAAKPPDRSHTITGDSAA